MDCIPWNIFHSDFRELAAPHYLDLSLCPGDLISGDLSSLAPPRSATKLRVGWRSDLFGLTALVGMHQSRTTRNTLRSPTCSYALVTQSILARTRSVNVATNLCNLATYRRDRIILATTLNNLECDPARHSYPIVDRTSPPDARIGMGQCALL